MRVDGAGAEAGSGRYRSQRRAGVAVLLGKLGRRVDQSHAVALARLGTHRPGPHTCHRPFVRSLTTRCHNELYQGMSRCFDPPRLRRLTVHEYGDPHGAAASTSRALQRPGLSGAAYDDAASRRPACACSPSTGRGTAVRTPPPAAPCSTSPTTSCTSPTPWPLDGSRSWGSPEVAHIALAVGSRVPERGQRPAGDLGRRPGVRALGRARHEAGEPAADGRGAPRAVGVAATDGPHAPSPAGSRPRPAAGGPAAEQAPAADQRVLTHLAGLSDITASPRDALRVSSRAAAQELSLLARPWGFDAVVGHVPGRALARRRGCQRPGLRWPSAGWVLPNAVAHVLPTRDTRSGGHGEQT